MRQLPLRVDDLARRDVDAEILGSKTMPAPRPDSSLSTLSKMSTFHPARRSKSPLSKPLIEPPMIIARFPWAPANCPASIFRFTQLFYI